MPTRHAGLDPLLARARELGAAEAKLVAPASVVTAPWVRWKCRYGCGCYGSSLCCPPHSPTPAETREMLDCYQRAILVHCVPPQEVRAVVIPLEREAFLAGFYRAFAFAEGPLPPVRGVRPAALRTRPRGTPGDGSLRHRRLRHRPRQRLPP